jgi:hypothetical protein
MSMKNSKTINLISIFLVVMLIISLFPTISFAGEPTKLDSTNNLIIKKISKNKVKVIDGKDEALISIVESDNKIHVKVSEKNPEKNSYFIADKATGKIYSSETKNTVDIKELLNDDTMLQKDSNSTLVQDGLLKAGSGSGYVGTVNQFISYKELSKLVTSSSSAASIAGAILTILGMVGITAANPIAGVVSIIGGIITVIQHGIGSKSPNHGIIIKMKKYRHVRYRAGMRLVRYSYEIVGVSRK